MWRMPITNERVISVHFLVKMVIFLFSSTFSIFWSYFGFTGNQTYVFLTEKKGMSCQGPFCTMKAFQMHYHLLSQLHLKTTRFVLVHQLCASLSHGGRWIAVQIGNQLF
jgi:hypothetical protein